MLAVAESVPKVATDSPVFCRFLGMLDILMLLAMDLVIIFSMIGFSACRLTMKRRQCRRSFILDYFKQPLHLDPCDLFSRQMLFGQ